MKKKRTLKEWSKILLSKYFYSLFYWDKSKDTKDTVFLSSVHRSGSTFLMESMNYNNEYRVIFEPFHHDKISMVEEFQSPFYIHPENTDKNTYDKFKLILEGSLRHSWSDAHNHKIIANKRLIKCVRTNLMLKYMHRNFPEIPIVLLIRNPFATVNSWIRSNYNKEAQRKRILGQDLLIHDYLDPFLERYKSLEDAFDIFIFNWCLSYYIPFKQFSKNEIHFVFYESMLDQPQKEIGRLFNYLKKDYDDSIFQQMNKPSRTTRKTDISKMGKSHFNSWKKNFSEEQISRGMDILKWFGLDKLYNEGVPSYTELEVLLDK